MKFREVKQNTEEVLTEGKSIFGKKPGKAPYKELEGTGWLESMYIDDDKFFAHVEKQFKAWAKATHDNWDISSLADDMGFDEDKYVMGDIIEAGAYDLKTYLLRRLAKLEAAIDKI